MHLITWQEIRLFWVFLLLFMAYVIYVSLICDLHLHFFQLIHIYTVNCDCNEFCQLVLVIKPLGILQQHFYNFVLVTKFDNDLTYLLVIA